MTPNIVKSLRGIMGVQDSSLGFGPGVFLGGLAGAGIGGIGRSALSHTAATKMGGMFNQGSWLRKGLSRARKSPLPAETAATPDSPPA